MLLILPYLVLENSQFMAALIIMLAIVILIIAVVFIVIGVANGGAADVLQKAVNICRECIGIG